MTSLLTGITVYTVYINIYVQDYTIQYKTRRI